MNTPLTVNDFPGFFRELWGHGCSPFPWQLEFARRLCAGKAPDYVAVPTGSGKTACLDAAVFALATQAGLSVAERTQGRRIFFIVNRRLIVDEAYERAGKLCEKLRNSNPDSVVGRVAKALRNLCGDPQAAPLGRVELRGGIYRDRSWATSLLQPMIICSTVDQAGSRLLFRGYGVSPQARPVHAALVAQDSLLIIDEAHISLPFIQTLEWVKRYRLHQSPGCETLQLPFQLLQLTATPPADVGDDRKIKLSAEDQEHPVLKPRLRSSKPARLIAEPKARGKSREEQLVKRMTEEAEKILKENQPRSIAVMVNRVATARAIAARLENDHPGRVTLLIGRLRPLEREATTKQLQVRLKTGTSLGDSDAAPLIVVSTQCLEVGADLDFDALVTEAASLDALRQRFGRLNRGGRAIEPRAAIVLPGDQDVSVEKLDDTMPCDPIYGNAVPRTWHWLKRLAESGMVDFGINAMTEAVKSISAGASGEALVGMLSPTANSPVLLPAYLDCWAQTNPAPAADPDVALFLHGPQREMAEVQVCWRGDLPEMEHEENWADILTLCPPSTAECLPVPLHIFRQWWGSRGTFEDRSADFSENPLYLVGNKDQEEAHRASAFVWRGPEGCFFVRHPSEVRPGDTIVLRVQGGGWQALGHLPCAPADPQETPGKTLSSDEIRRVDLGEHATACTRRRAMIRIHSALWPTSEASSPAAALKEIALDPQKDWHIPVMKDLLEQFSTGLAGVSSASSQAVQFSANDLSAEVIAHLASKRTRLYAEPYPDNMGMVLIARDLLPHDDYDITETDADGLLEASQPEELFDHTKNVLHHLERALALLPLAPYTEALIEAATKHDWGKADPRFQALLRGSTPFAAMAATTLLAKSGSLGSSAAGRRAARERSGLPQGFRHEMISEQMAERSMPPASPLVQDLALHLVATHHGYGRPFAPIWDDDTPPDVSLASNGQMTTITGSERLKYPSYALDSGIAERFWKMNRHFGWWGIAFLEAVLRLADQSASANPNIWKS